MTQNNLLAIVTMWDKINQLSRESLSQAQIAVALGVSRDTFFISASMVPLTLATFSDPINFDALAYIVRMPDLQAW